MNKNAGRRFLKTRGVLKEFDEFAMNRQTGKLLDKEETILGRSTGGEYRLIFRIETSKITKKVSVSEFRLVAADQIGETALRK